MGYRAEPSAAVLMQSHSKTFSDFIEIDDFRQRFIENEVNPFWVFSYGSLIWYISFRASKRLIGFVQGVRRNFSHASFRFGVPDWPGRVATLVPQSEGRTWGVAYKIVGREEKQCAFESLERREIDQGYTIRMIDFTDAFTNNTFQVAVYVTSPAAQVWLREVPMDIQAYQVYKSNNSVWPNKVYVCKIADFLRNEVLSNFPEADDVHTDPAMILETYIREYEMGVRSLSNVNAKDVRPIIVSGEDQFKI